MTHRDPTDYDGHYSAEAREGIWSSFATDGTTPSEAASPEDPFKYWPVYARGPVGEAGVLPPLERVTGHLTPDQARRAEDISRRLAEAYELRERASAPPERTLIASLSSAMVETVRRSQNSIARIGQLDYRKVEMVAGLISLVLPRKVRLDVYKPTIDEIREDHREYRKKHRAAWWRAGVNIAFIVKATLILVQCFRIAAFRWVTRPLRNVIGSFRASRPSSLD